MTVTLHIAKEQHYDCIQCGRCCRRFQVFLRPGEVNLVTQAHAALGLPPEYPPCGLFNGQPYIGSKPDGQCVFLDTDGCLIHRQFGHAAKPLSCRGYPLNFVSTFPGEASVMARFDCPAVARQHGPPLHSRRHEIEAIAAELPFGAWFTARDCHGLERRSLEYLCLTLRQALETYAGLPPARLASGLLSIGERWQRLGVTFLNDFQTLQTIMPSLLEKTFTTLDDLPKLDVSFFSRCHFRQWLSLYCRREGETPQLSLTNRCRRAWLTLQTVCGYGNWRGYGQEHPDFPVVKARLFRSPSSMPVLAPETWEPYRRFLDTRIECLQFFGPAYYGQPFFIGLRALLMTYPLVLAMARCHAASRGADDITVDDILYGVSALDHCHGRSAVLSLRLARNAETYFSGERFFRLLYALGLH